MGLLRTIAIILLFLFLVRFLGRLFAPIINPNKGQNRNASSADNRPEGDVRIEFPNKDKASGKKSDKGGEYIDFEEVDD